ncbi:phosphodiester glycosidase family protein [Kitasatospora sp. NPDC094028]
MVGVTAPDATGKHKLLMVTVDGRDADTSIGMSILETAQLMKALGAQQALSMGCGGDTAMFINGTLCNNPHERLGHPGPAQPLRAAPRQRPGGAAQEVT